MVQVDFKTVLFAQSNTGEQPSKSEAENAERDRGESLFSLASHA